MPITRTAFEQGECMTVKDAIARRRSIRKFSGAPVTGAQIREMLEAARLSPSSINSQPWRFRVVTDRPTIEWFATTPTKGQRWIASAAAVFVCCVDTGGYLKDSRANYKVLKDSGMLPATMADGVERYLDSFENGPEMALRGAAVLNLAIAVSAMMLSAVELGLGSTWVGMVDETMTKERLNLPEHVNVIALLPVGVPGEAPDPRPRRHLDDILC